MLPSPPQRDKFGNVLPHDHPDILNEDGIVRRFDPKRHVVSDPKSTTGKRISSLWLKDDSGISIDLLRPMLEDGVDARAFVTTPDYTGSVKFVAGDLRNAGFRIGYDPVSKNEPSGPENPYHGLLWGRLTKGQFNRLLSMAEWFVRIDGVSLL